MSLSKTSRLFLNFLASSIVYPFKLLNLGSEKDKKSRLKTTRLDTRHILFQTQWTFPKRGKW